MEDVLHPFPNGFAAALRCVLAAGVLSGAPFRDTGAAPLKPPRVGIDTTFGDRFQAARAALDAERWEEVIARTTAALALNPDPKNAAILYAWRGYARSSRGEDFGALEDYNQALRNDPNEELARANRAILRIQQGEYAAAAADLTTAMRAHPNDFDVYAVRGGAYLSLGQRERARADFQRFLGFRPQTAVDHVRRGKIFNFLGDYAQAKSAYDRAVRGARRDSSIYNQVAWFQATCPNPAFRDGKAALRNATRACELSGWRDPAGIDTLAVAHAEVGQFGEAIRYAKQALATGNAFARVRADMQAHLRAFERGQPWREETKL